MIFKKSEFIVKKLETDEEYEQLLELRKKSYLNRPNVTKETANSNVDISFFGDNLDKNSSIYLYIIDGTIKASTRVLYGQENNNFQIYSYFSNLPPFLTRTEELVEYSRACVDPDYKYRTNALVALFAEITKEVNAKGYKAVVAATPENLVKLYTAIGFKNTGVSQMVSDPWASSPDEKLKLSLIYSPIEKFKTLLRF